MAPTLFSKFIPNILPPAVESELSEYAAEDQKLQRELIQNGFTRQGFFCFFLFDKICPFPSAILAWQGREARVLRTGNSHRAVKVMLLGEGVSCLYLVLWKLPFTKHGFGRKALSFWGGNEGGRPISALPVVTLYIVLTISEML